MQEFMELALGFPTGIFTGLLVVVLIYWGFVMLGALDIDLFDVDADTDLDVDLDADVDVDVDVDADIDADVDADVDVGTHAHHGGGVGGALRAIGLGGVPITIVFSVLVIFSWVLCMAFTGPLWDVAVGGSYGLAVAGALGMAAFVVALPLTSIATRPLRGAFVVHQAPRRKTFVGQTCRVTTQRVTASFGQAEIEDGGAGLLVQVRCERDNGLTKDSEAIVFEYDRKREVYLVAPIGDAVVPVEHDSQ